MIICSMPGCTTTAGCKCGNGWPLQYQTRPKSIAEFTDAELRNELHRRAQNFLGGPTVGVTVPRPDQPPTENAHD